MEQVIECPCGTVLREGTLSDVVQAARSHAKEVHDMDLAEDQAEAMAHPG